MAKFNPLDHRVNNYKNEEQFQAAAIMMISQQFPQFRGRVWHTKNEGYIQRKEGESDEAYEKRKMREGARNKAEGMLSGVPDISIIYKGIYYGIELKQPNGYLSKTQEEFHRNCAIDCPIKPLVKCKTLFEVWDYCNWIINNGFKIFI